MRRAAAAVPEVVLLLRQMPSVLGHERLLETKPAARVDWRRACLQYEEDVLRTYAKRCRNDR